MNETSPRKIAANRRNARRSTGPRTPEGKAVAALNARRHGLLARDPVVPGEDADAYAAVRDRLHKDLAPVGELEEFLVDRVASLSWRLARLTGIEAALLEPDEDDYTDYSGNERTPRQVLTRVFHGHVEDLTTLSRYEVLLDRTLTKVLHELERRQASRSGVYVPPPAAVDVALDVTSTNLDGTGAEA